MVLHSKVEGVIGIIVPCIQCHSNTYTTHSKRLKCTLSRELSNGDSLVFSRGVTLFEVFKYEREEKIGLFTDALVTLVKETHVLISMEGRE